MHWHMRNSNVRGSHRAQFMIFIVAVLFGLRCSTLCLLLYRSSSTLYCSSVLLGKSCLQELLFLLHAMHTLSSLLLRISLLRRPLASLGPWPFWDLRQMKKKQKKTKSPTKSGAKTWICVSCRPSSTGCSSDSFGREGLSLAG